MVNALGVGIYWWYLNVVSYGNCPKSFLTCVEHLLEILKIILFVLQIQETVTKYDLLYPFIFDDLVFKFRLLLNCLDILFMQCIRCLRQTSAFASPGANSPASQNDKETWWISRWVCGCPMCGGTWVRVV